MGDRKLYTGEFLTCDGAHGTEGQPFTGNQLAGVNRAEKAWKSAYV